MFKFLSSDPVHNPTASSTADTEVKTTTCYMCACRCGIRVHLRDGQVRYIDGNPDHPLNKGVICAKGSSGIMKQVSPARLTQPLLRKPGSERGEGVFEPISWERAFDILETRLSHLRATDPKKFALFTGRDQMQALTGLFARQFGTPNYAAHGGFCSVNMAAGMIYSVGGSFWEFGGPDLDHAKLFVMIGTAEDHHSNPMKMALGKFKRAGGRFISINPVRTGYSAIADEWIPIRPGTDGALFMALLHELIAQWKSDHPHCRVLVDIANTHDVFERLVSFRADMGFIEGTHSHPELTVRKWRNDEIVVVAAPDHPLAGRRVSVRQLAQATWVLREPGSGTREASDRWLIPHLTQMEVELELGSNEAVKRVVAAGLGLGCLSRLAVQEAIAEGWLVELRTTLPAMQRTLSIVLHRAKKLGETAEGFLRHCMRS